VLPCRGAQRQPPLDRHVGVWATYEDQASASWPPTSRWWIDTEHAARYTVLSRSMRLQIFSKRTLWREFQSWLCVSVSSTIGFFRALSDWVFGVCGRAEKWMWACERRRWRVWVSSEQREMGRASERGRWRRQVISERGKIVCRRRWGREEEEEGETGNKVH
jgi:hypothetical protein